MFTKACSNPTIKIFLMFVVWRIVLELFAVISIGLIPLRSHDFLGGTYDNYSQNPLFWGWGNFDGEHYLSIVQKGYESLQQAFFPGYPLLIHYSAYLFGLAETNILITGLIISNLSFLFSLLLLRKIIRLDFQEKVVNYALLAVLVFPTSFYFGSFYTESPFLLLILASYYFIRKKRWLLAGLLGGLASSFRLVGIFLLPVAVFEFYLTWRESKKLERGYLFALLLFPAGLIAYMIYLQITQGDPIIFYALQPMVGEHRTTQLIPIYQVFWRYLKMLTIFRLDQAYFTVVMEFTIAVLGLFLIILGYFRKIRISYLLFSMLGFLLPTFTGSFSSLPRYVLVLFPFYVIIGEYISNKCFFFKYIVYCTSLLLLSIETMLFFRGYWIA